VYGREISDALEAVSAGMWLHRNGQRRVWDTYKPNMARTRDDTVVAKIGFRVVIAFG